MSHDIPWQPKEWLENGDSHSNDACKIHFIMKTSKKSVPGAVSRVFFMVEPIDEIRQGMLDVLCHREH